ncbi:MAG: hypothetical protein ACRCX2_10465, partial [Paraclostridium sp.]
LLNEIVNHPGWEVVKKEVDGELDAIDAIFHGASNDTGLTLDELRQRYVGINLIVDKINKNIESYSQALDVKNLDVSEYDPYNIEVDESTN